MAAAVFVWHAVHTVAPPAGRPTDAPVIESNAIAAVEDAAPPVASRPVESPVVESWPPAPSAVSTAASFAYAKNHQGTPLPAVSLAALANTGGWQAEDGDSFAEPRDAPVDINAGLLQRLSRSALCSAIVSAARANELPIPFFANLIWQESSFQSKTISPAGALGIAQFIPETATEHGLMNPFEPIHALFASAKLLRKLNDQFGNLGLAAAAYNAGPQRVFGWLAERRTLPGETRSYVARITGRGADQWRSNEIQRDPEATLMPATAPCMEVKEAVQAQAKFVRIAKLMSELAAATDIGSAAALANLPLPRPDPRRIDKIAGRSDAAIRSGPKAVATKTSTKIRQPSAPGQRRIAAR